MRYQTHLPTIALAFRDDHHAAVTIPAGTMMNLIGPAEDDRFVVVEVDGEKLQVFETDLMNRSAARAARERRASRLSTRSLEVQS